MMHILDVNIRKNFIIGYHCITSHRFVLIKLWAGYMEKRIKSF